MASKTPHKPVWVKWRTQRIWTALDARPGEKTAKSARIAGVEPAASTPGLQAKIHADEP